MKQLVAYYVLSVVCALSGLAALGFAGAADQTPLTCGQFVGIVVFGGVSFMAGRAASRIARKGEA